jgi:hypothetical protein
LLIAACVGLILGNQRIFSGAIMGFLLTHPHCSSYWIDRLKRRTIMTSTQTKPANPNEAKPTLGLGKPTADAKTAPEVKVSLKAICSEMKLEPREAREKLRIAVREAKKYPELAKAHKPRSAWEWPKGSPVAG